MTDRLITFHRSSPPYEPGDTAGFPALHARRLVARGVARYADDQAPPDFGKMSRAEMVRYALEVLGFEDVPPASVTDDELRAALTAQTRGEAEVEPAGGGEGEGAGADGASASGGEKTEGDKASAKGK